MFGVSDEELAANPALVADAVPSAHIRAAATPFWRHILAQVPRNCSVDTIGRVDCLIAKRVFTVASYGSSISDLPYHCNHIIATSSPFISLKWYELLLLLGCASEFD